MKILHTVESYLPARHGMSEVVRQLSERLVAKGHEVVVATGSNKERTHNLIDGVKIRAFDVRGSSGRGIAGDICDYQQFLLNSDFDIVVNFAAQQWATDLCLPLLGIIKGKKVFVPTGFSGLYDPIFSSYFARLSTHMRAYDANVFLSNHYRDIDYARAHDVEKIAIIPNGAAADEFNSPPDPDFRRKWGIRQDEAILVHIAGYVSLEKGQVNAVQIFNQSGIRNAVLLLISPQLDAKGLCSPRIRKLFAHHYAHIATAIGAVRPKSVVPLLRNRAAGRRVVACNMERADVISALHHADMMLFPSRIECSPLVLFEAAATKTPFAVSDVGNAREIIDWTGGGVLLPGNHQANRSRTFVPRLRDSARRLAELWADKGRLAEMSRTAHEAWRQHFTWKHLADKYESLYEMLLAGQPIQGAFPPPPTLSR